jgi:hypothetical protein
VAICDMIDYVLELLETSSVPSARIRIYLTWVSIWLSHSDLGNRDI